jgi:outer membrane biogenesis lipoprotein LolB
LAAVIHALKIWRHHLMGAKCNIYTDHKRLKYIFTQADLNMRQRLWQNQPELYQLKYASPLQRAPTYFKWYNPLACWVASR